MMFESAEALTKEYDLLPPGTGVLCAVSGGADSMCLLHWLSRRKDLTLWCAHFDHQLRGEDSAADAAFVQEMCKSWGIPLHLGGADVAGEARRRGTGIEETARSLRYDFLEGLAQGLGAVVATAHTADDNAETMLLNLIRGTGLKGLAGIPPRRGRIVRPLLTTTRAEIVAYLKANGIPHREDASNTDETYSRNRLRHQVLPVLRELNPRAVERMGETARQLRELDGSLDSLAGEVLTLAGWEGDRLSVPIAALRSLPEPAGARALQGLLDALGVGRKDFGAVHLRAVLDLKPGGHLDLPAGVGADLRRGTLFLTRRASRYNPKERGEPS